MSDPKEEWVGTGEMKRIVPIGRKLLRIEELGEDHPDFKEAGEHLGYTLRLVYDKGNPTLIHGNHDSDVEIETTLPEKLMEMGAIINKRRRAMVRSWKESFDVRILFIHEINIVALRSGDRKAQEIAVRGALKDIPDLFDQFDKKVREFRRGHEALVLRGPVDVCWSSPEDCAVWMTAWTHTSNEASGMGEVYGKDW